MSDYLENLARRRDQGLLYGSAKSDSPELIRGFEYAISEMSVLSKAALAPAYDLPLIESQLKYGKVKYQNTSILRDDGMLYYTGEIFGLMLIPLIVASLIVLFKRFRSKRNFLCWGVGLLWVLAAIQAFGLSALGEDIGLFLLKIAVATGLLFLLAYIKDVLLWLKKEII